MTDLRPIDAGMRPWSVGATTAWTVLFALASLAATVVGVIVYATAGRSDAAHTVGSFVALSGGVAFVISLVVWRWPAREHYRRILAKEFPKAAVFHSWLPGIPVMVIREVDGPAARESIRGLAARNSWLVGEDDRLSLWARRGRTLEAYLVMPRDRVVDIRASHVGKAAAADTIRVVELRAFDGSVVDVALPAATRWGGTPKAQAAAAQTGAQWLSDWWSRGA